MPRGDRIDPLHSLKKQKDGGRVGTAAAEGKPGAKAPAAPGRPSPSQRRYLEQGLGQPGGKLPLFDSDGQEFPHRTIRACLEKGWAEPWFDNPTKPDWVVARLTAAGRRALGGKAER
ncbi:hypothetical protein [Prosthecodimorpha hirschii]|uniref:hypothetical protein n=1 Tax=Prosthecodimorpha hirschii TaxID=665126 RepID=UPI001AEE0979|nr:hypothetical protein [Prosthecomicrobium hirschii]